MDRARFREARLSRKPAPRYCPNRIRLGLGCADVCTVTSRRVSCQTEYDANTSRIRS